MILPQVSIIVLNYNGLRYLGGCLDKCLESVLSTDYPNFELIFVDNGSNDESDKHISTFFNDKRLKIIRLERNYGFARGINMALLEINSNSEYIAVLNNDVTVANDWLTHIVNAMQQDEKIGIAQGLLVDSCTGKRIADTFIDPSNGHRISDQTKSKYILMARGGASVVRRELLRQIGMLFDDYYFLYCEDADLSLRTWLSGNAIVVVEESKIYHMGSVTVRSLPVFYLRKIYYKNQMYLICKFARAMSIPWLILFKLISGLSVGFVQAIKHKNPSYCYAVFYGLRMFIEEYRTVYKHIKTCRPLVNRLRSRRCGRRWVTDARTLVKLIFL